MGYVERNPDRMSAAALESGAVEEWIEGIHMTDARKQILKLVEERLASYPSRTHWDIARHLVEIVRVTGKAAGLPGQDRVHPVSFANYMIELAALAVACAESEAIFTPTPPKEESSGVPQS